MALAPAWGGPHILAAHWLASKGRREQALAELRAAAEVDPDRALSELCVWVEQTPTVETVMAVVPRAGAARTDALDLGARCLGQAVLEADKIDTLLLAEAPQHVEARLRRARRHVAAGRWEAALDQVRTIQADAPTLADAYRLEAESLLGLNKPQLAEERLRAALQLVTDRKPLLMQLSWVQAVAGNESGMRDTIDQLRMASAGIPADLANAAAHLAECESRLGNHARALRAVREANSLFPKHAFLARAAGLAAALGETDFALSAWERLCAQEREYCPARDALKIRLQAP